MTARHLLITGRVQGVGYRDWLTSRARKHGLSGWVRNLRDGSVEALIDGPEPAIEEILRLCRRGPPLAHVIAINETLADPPENPGFIRLPTL